MIAVLSDVHANLEALRAVLLDLRRHNITRIVFLGDIIGYGPNPREVLNFMEQFEFCLMGNHDRAVLTGPPKSFNPVAQKATEWTRKRIHPSYVSFIRRWEKRKRMQHWRFLASLKAAAKIGDMMFVHDTPAAPGSDKYVSSVEAAQEAMAAYPNMKTFFIGHSHVPAIWTSRERSRPEWGRHYQFDGQAVINVGSVGQPRDKDPRACYVIVDEQGIRFFRVEYDIERTAKKIRKSELDNILADRLLKGM